MYSPHLLELRALVDRVERHSVHSSLHIRSHLLLDFVDEFSSLNAWRDGQYSARKASGALTARHRELVWIGELVMLLHVDHVLEPSLLLRAHLLDLKLREVVFFERLEVLLDDGVLLLSVVEPLRQILGCATISSESQRMVHHIPIECTRRTFISFQTSLRRSWRCPHVISLARIAHAFETAHMRSAASPSVRPTPGRKL